MEDLIKLKKYLETFENLSKIYQVYENEQSQ